MPALNHFRLPCLDNDWFTPVANATSIRWRGRHGGLRAQECYQQFDQGHDSTVLFTVTPMRIDTRARVADWITIVTAPFTIVSVFGSLTGWLPNTVAAHANSDEKRLAIAIILTCGQWLSLFSLLIYYFKQQTRVSSDLGILFSIVAGFLGLAIVLAIELLIVNAVVSQFPREGLIFWLGIPGTAWLICGFFALLVIQSEVSSEA
jgi:hypothetical protein